MGAGSASVAMFQRIVPVPGPPFQPTAAENGTSIDPGNGRIVLGNDIGLITATLLSDREIPMAGKKIDFTDPAGLIELLQGAIILDNLAGVVTTLTPGDILLQDNVAARTAEFNVVSFPSFININDPGNTGTVNFQTNGIGQLVAPNGVWSVDTGNGTAAFQRIQTSVGLPVQYLMSDGTNELGISYLARVMDIGSVNVGNGTKVTIDDLNKQVIQVTDNGFFYMQNTLGSSFFEINVAAGSYSMGDLSALLNGTVLQVDDIGGLLRISNTANTAAVSINGVTGFTGTVANPVTITVDGGIVTNVA